MTNEFVLIDFRPTFLIPNPTMWTFFGTTVSTSEIPIHVHEYDWIYHIRLYQSVFNASHNNNTYVYICSFCSHCMWQKTMTILWFCRCASVRMCVCVWTWMSLVSRSHFLPPRLLLFALAVVIRAFIASTIENHLHVQAMGKLDATYAYIVLEHCVICDMNKVCQFFSSLDDP